MGLLDLFVAASMPVLKVLLVTGLGLILALDRIDLLGDDARKHLNNSFKLQGLPNIFVDWSLAVVLQVCKNSKNLSDEDNCNSGDYDDTIDANSLHILYDLFSFTRNLTNFQTSIAQVVLK
ncbi:hypothetical protein BC332_13241 [Capsicum chinense]|nr:hypothetical protein BC332_13241 [Capsicum chinense]